MELLSQTVEHLRNDVGVSFALRTALQKVLHALIMSTDTEKCANECPGQLTVRIEEMWNRRIANLDKKRAIF